MKAFVASFVLLLILNSCCSPHYVGYVNPLDLEPVGYEKTCPLIPCRSGDVCPGGKLPWVNLEYNRTNQNIGKIGFAYIGYTSNSVLSFSGNYITNFASSSKQTILNGVGTDIQLGILPMNNYFTTFVGIENNYFLGDNSFYQFNPSLGFAFPKPIVNALQFKAGYQFNHKQINYWTFGVNIKAPLLHHIF